MARIVITALALFLGLGCGGSQEPETTVNPPPSTDPAPPPPTTEQKNETKLKEAQSVGCDGLCNKVTNCAVDDAKANLPPEKLAELKLEETVPVALQKCNEDCSAKELSVRQVEVLHGCLNEDAVCDQFLKCIDAMSPQAE